MKAGTCAPEFAFIALGANLPSDEGSPRATLEAALAALSPLSPQPLQVSSFWQSDPVDCPPGSPVFVNAVAAIVPMDNETPLGLLRKLQAIELDFGRQRSGVVNEARVLDLDLISFRDQSLSIPELILPHPRAHKRAFVLAPLAELAPELILPGQQDTVANLLAGLQDQTLQRLLRIPDFR